MMVTAVALIATMALAAGLRYEARMSGAGKGKAKWQVANKRGEFQGEFEVEGENMARNANFTVNVGGNSFPVTTNGLGRFAFSARYSNAATAPVIGVGTGVDVKDANGAVVMTGVFAQR